MRRLGQLLGTGVLLMVCVACGQGEDIGFGGQPPTTEPAEQSPPVTVPIEPPSGDPMNPQPPAGGTAVDEAKVDEAALPEGYPDLVWTEGDGTVVGAYGQAGGCIEATAAATEQTAQNVVLVITETTKSEGPCTMDIRYPPLTVKLDAPLGDRTVVLQREQVGPR